MDALYIIMCGNAGCLLALSAYITPYVYNARCEGRKVDVDAIQKTTGYKATSAIGAYLGVYFYLHVL